MIATCDRQLRVWVHSVELRVEVRCALDPRLVLLDDIGVGLALRKTVILLVTVSSALRPLLKPVARSVFVHRASTVATVRVELAHLDVIDQLLLGHLVQIQVFQVRNAAILLLVQFGKLDLAIASVVLLDFHFLMSFAIRSQLNTELVWRSVEICARHPRSWLALLAQFLDNLKLRRVWIPAPIPVTWTHFL